MHDMLNIDMCEKLVYIYFTTRMELGRSATNESINHQSNPVLLKERVRIPRTRRAGGAAMLWGALPLDGVGSCRLFFTDDLHDTLSWGPATDKPHTFKSCFTHSSQVFFGRPGPFHPGTGLDLTLFISPNERMACPNHLSRSSRTRTARSHIPSLACRSSIDGSSDDLTPQIQRIIAPDGWPTYSRTAHSTWELAGILQDIQPEPRSRGLCFSHVYMKTLEFQSLLPRLDMFNTFFKRSSNDHEIVCKEQHPGHPHP